MDWLDGIARIWKKLLGEFWYPVIRDSIQDAIGAYVVLSIGGLAGNLIAGKDFSAFSVCYAELQTDPTGVIPYVCYGMVILDFAMWAAVLARLIFRALLQLIPQGLRKISQANQQKTAQPTATVQAQTNPTGGGQHDQ